MKRFTGIGGSQGAGPGALNEPVCTVGVFDGVHRGHRQLLYELNLWASTVGGESCVITFERHPLEALRGLQVSTILSLEHRLLEFERHGVAGALVLDFSIVRPMGAEQFLQKILIDGLGCRRLLLGFDSRLGRDREGGSDNLPGIGKRLGIEVRIASPVLDREGRKIGSSAIRDSIQRGELAAAANVLGRPYSLRGAVIHGEGRGKGLGTATANMEVADQVLPPDGVYLVRVYRGADTAPAIANLGVRPTFHEGGGRFLEVHVPGWEADLYGEVLEVRLVRRIREERRFADVDALRQQISRDLEALARAVKRGEV